MFVKTGWIPPRPDQVFKNMIMPLGSFDFCSKMSFSPPLSLYHLSTSFGNFESRVLTAERGRGDPSLGAGTTKVGNHLKVLGKHCKKQVRLKPFLVLNKNVGNYIKVLDKH